MIVSTPEEESDVKLLGEKCARCGEARTRQSYEGIPTCESCEELLEARKRADAEDRRGCPVDGEAMAKDVVLGIVIDRCPTCKGVWLDGGELDLIRNAVTAGVSMDLARAMAVYP